MAEVSVPTSSAADAEGAGFVDPVGVPAEPRMVRPFEVVSPFEPAGDQPKAIASLADGIEGESDSRRSWVSPDRASPPRWPGRSRRFSGQR
ncbi:MAG: hypothetical protein R2789_09545 [Microthrixaceae bacterium]